MDPEKIFQDFSRLTPEAQKVVAELIAFLRKQNGQPVPVQKAKKQTRLANEKFIGMWKDRPEMEDSRAYVRAMRQREWSGHE